MILLQVVLPIALSDIDADIMSALGGEHGRGNRWSASGRRAKYEGMGGRDLQDRLAEWEFHPHR